MTDYLRTRISAAALLALTVVAPLALSRQADAALSFTVDANNWPSSAQRTAAVNAMQNVVNRYNAFGDFGNYNIYVYYNAGIPTAQANYLGSIGFGGTYPNERVAMHETAHYLGSGTTSQWAGLMTGGSWDGAIATALIKQFDGEQEYLHGDTQHFWPYGLNYDSEGSEINKQRQVAVMYAQRADMGLGPVRYPSSATTVNLTASDAAGESGFNYKTKWSDGYFAHAGADYFTGPYLMRTPESPNSFTFVGDSLTLNNPAPDTGLYFRGVGTDGVTTFQNLILDGGWVDHRSANNLADLFQLDGKITVQSDSTIRAYNGNINILANVTGSGNLTIPTTNNPTENNRYVRFLSPNNSFVGDVINESRFELGSSGNFTFKIEQPGINNAITGAAARSTRLLGTFDFDLSAASSQAGDSWNVVTAANTFYGASFKVAGFTNKAGIWKNGSYAFDPATGVLSVLPPPPTWNTDGGGLWTDAGNWTSAPAANDDVVFGPVLTAPHAPAAVTLDVAASANTLSFDNQHQYTIGGAGGLTLTGEATIDVRQGSHVVAVPIAGSAGLRVTGGGWVTLTAANPYSGDTNVDAGTLALAGSASIGNSGHVNVHPGATLDVSGLESDFVVPGAQTLVNNSDQTVVGSVVAASGATVRGTGTFDGNLTAQAGSVVRIGPDGLSTVTPVIGQVKYVDATTAARGNTARADGTAFSPKPEGITGADDDWELRTLGNNATTFEAGGETAEDAYELKTILFGLNPFEAYQVRAFFWDPTGTNEDWNIRAGFESNPGANPLYSAADATAELGATAAEPASNLTFVSTPLLAESGRALLSALVGTRTADENGRIEVFIDDMPSAVGANRRTWYDGLGVSQIAPVAMVVGGDYTQEDGATLVMDLLSASNHDQLIVGGTFTAGGALQVVLNTGGAALAVGDSFDLFDFAEAAGSFASLDLPALAAGMTWDTSVLYSEGVLRIAAALAGDYNNDGTIDAADYTIWRDNLGAATLPNRAPGIGGAVGTADYDYWESHFGMTLAAGGGSVANVAVPETCTAIMLLVGLASLHRLAHRRQLP